LVHVLGQSYFVEHNQPIDGLPLQSNRPTTTQELHDIVSGQLLDLARAPPAAGLDTGYIIIKAQGVDQLPTLQLFGFQAKPGRIVALIFTQRGIDYAVVAQNTQGLSVSQKYVELLQELTAQTEAFGYQLRENTISHDETNYARATPALKFTVFLCKHNILLDSRSGLRSEASLQELIALAALHNVAKASDVQALLSGALPWLPLHHMMLKCVLEAQNSTDPEEYAHAASIGSISLHDFGEEASPPNLLELVFKNNMLGLENLIVEIARNHHTCSTCNSSAVHARQLLLKSRSSWPFARLQSLPPTTHLRVVKYQNAFVVFHVSDKPNFGLPDPT